MPFRDVNWGLVFAALIGMGWLVVWWLSLRHDGPPGGQDTRQREGAVASLPDWCWAIIILAIVTAVARGLVCMALLFA